MLAASTLMAGLMSKLKPSFKALAPAMSLLLFCEWSKALKGPIRDFLGIEQGGVNSDRLYKLANNDQLNVAQLSNLGIDLGTSIISCIGQTLNLMSNT
jgi:hypothetical protein